LKLGPGRRVLPYVPRWESGNCEVDVRITFIEPAAPGFHVYSFVKQLRLGLPLLGALMKARGHEVRIYAESLSGCAKRASPRSWGGRT